MSVFLDFIPNWHHRAALNSIRSKGFQGERSRKTNQRWKGNWQDFLLPLSQYTEAYRNHEHNEMQREVRATHTHTCSDEKIFNPPRYTNKQKREVNEGCKQTETFKRMKITGTEREHSLIFTDENWVFAFPPRSCKCKRSRRTQDSSGQGIQKHTQKIILW